MPNGQQFQHLLNPQVPPGIVDISARLREIQQFYAEATRLEAEYTKMLAEKEAEKEYLAEFERLRIRDLAFLTEISLADIEAREEENLEERKRLVADFVKYTTDLTKTDFTTKALISRSGWEEIYKITKDVCEKIKGFSFVNAEEINQILTNFERQNIHIFEYFGRLALGTRLKILDAAVAQQLLTEERANQLRVEVLATGNERILEITKKFVEGRALLTKEMNERLAEDAKKGGLRQKAIQEESQEASLKLSQYYEDSLRRITLTGGEGRIEERKDLGIIARLYEEKTTDEILKGIEDREITAETLRRRYFDREESLRARILRRISDFTRKVAKFDYLQFREKEKAIRMTEKETIAWITRNIRDEKLREVMIAGATLSAREQLSALGTSYGTAGKAAVAFGGTAGIAIAAIGGVITKTLAAITGITSFAVFVKKLIDAFDRLSKSGSVVEIGLVALTGTTDRAAFGLGRAFEYGAKLRSEVMRFLDPQLTMIIGMGKLSEMLSRVVTQTTFVTEQTRGFRTEIVRWRRDVDPAIERLKIIPVLGERAGDIQAELAIRAGLLSVAFTGMTDKGIEYAITAYRGLNATGIEILKSMAYMQKAAVATGMHYVEFSKIIETAIPQLGLLGIRLGDLTRGLGAFAMQARAAGIPITAIQGITSELLKAFLVPFPVHLAELMMAYPERLLTPQAALSQLATYVTGGTYFLNRIMAMRKILERFGMMPMPGQRFDLRAIMFMAQQWGISPFAIMRFNKEIFDVMEGTMLAGYEATDLQERIQAYTDIGAKIMLDQRGLLEKLVSLTSGILDALVILIGRLVGVRPEEEVRMRYQHDLFTEITEGVKQGEGLFRPMEFMIPRPGM